MLRSATADIPIVQAGFFRPIIERLDGAGAPVATLLRRASLHRFELSNSENYVPVELMYCLFEEIKRHEGIDDFFEVFADQVNAKGACDWLNIVAVSPDLFSAINFATEYEDVVLTHQRIWLEINGPVSKFSMAYLDQSQYLEKPRLGREFTDYTDLCLAYNLWKQVGGPDWQPLEIHLQSLVAPDFENLLPTGSSTKILFGQPATSLVFSTAMLSAPLQGEGSVVPPQTFEGSPQSMSSTIEKLLCSARGGQVANLGIVAHMLGLSPRTVRRRLHDEGTTFSEIVDTWRFKSSLRLLGQASTRVNEIAECLGYANTPNFERAFKRWTGRSPGAYRDALL